MRDVRDFLKIDIFKKSLYHFFMSINVYSLGAAEEVTGSKHILDVDGYLYLFDCGAFQGKTAILMFLPIN